MNRFHQYLTPINIMSKRTEDVHLMQILIDMFRTELHYIQDKSSFNFVKMSYIFRGIFGVN